MSIVTFSTHDLTEAQYEALRYEVLLDTEGLGDIGEPGLVYLDSTGNYSIGIGFNLEDPDTCDAVIRYFFTGSPTGTLLGADADYADDIEGIINSATSKPQIRSALNAKMIERKNYWEGVLNDNPAAVVPSGLRSTFTFSSSTDARLVFDYVVDDPTNGKEHVVDQWLSFKGITSIDNYSKERIVLVSLAYNNLIHETTGSPSLANAILAGNRAEAWYQIRYASNGGDSRGNGIAKRRYYESQIFGLYDSDGNRSPEDQAIQIYQMITRHRLNDGNALGITAYDALFGGQVLQASTDYNAEVQTTEQALHQAKLQITSDLGIGENLVDKIWIDYTANVDGTGPETNNLDFSTSNKNILVFGRDGDDLISGGSGNDYLYGDSPDLGNSADNLQHGNDTLHGGNGKDFLYGGLSNDRLEGDGNDDSLFGGSGIDELVGGAGLDYLEGGMDDDIYYYSFTSNITVSKDGLARHIISDGYDVVSEEYNQGTDNIQISGAQKNDLLFAVLGNDLIIFRSAYTTTLNGVKSSYDAGGVFIINGAHGSPIESISIGELFIPKKYFDPSNAGFLWPNNPAYDPDDVHNVHFVTLTADQIEEFSAIHDSILFGDGSVAEELAKIEPGTGDADNILGNVGSDTINAGAGGDIVFAGSGNDAVNGDDGEDEIYGDDGKDSLSGGAGSDIIYGGADDDTLSGGSGQDELHGGDGSDIIYASTISSVTDDSSNVLYGDDGDDTLYGASQNDTLYGGNGSDTIYGYDGDDYIDGGNDDSDVGGSFNTLYGGNGNDYILTGYGSTTVYGGNGNDTIRSVGSNDISSSNNLIYADAGNDTVYGGHGQDTIYGGDGDDNIDAFDGDDVVYGDAGNDHINGNSGQDLLYGGDGDDDVVGGDGDDVINGGEGADLLTGGNGNDTIYGGAGADIIYGDSSNLAYSQGISNTIIGGDGDDQIYDWVSAGHLEGNSGNDIIVGGYNTYVDGGDGNDAITIGSGVAYGGTGNDTITGAGIIYGGVGSDTIFSTSLDTGSSHVAHGGDDADAIYGGAQDDIIYGDAGNDTIALSWGTDNLYGGDGDDLFTYALNVNDLAAEVYVSGTTLNNLETGMSVDISGMSAIYTAIDGGNGQDQLNLTTSHFVVRLDAPDLPLNGTNEQRLINIEKIDMSNSGGGVIDLTSSRFFLGNIEINGGWGGDVIWSSSGNDTIYGNGGDDFIFGGAGNDIIGTGGGNDTVYGGDGNDTILIQGGSSSDESFKYLDGGLGNDVYLMNVSDIADRSSITLSNAGGDDAFYLNTDSYAAIYQYTITMRQQAGTDDLTVYFGGKYFSFKNIFAFDDDLKVTSFVLQNAEYGDLAFDFSDPSRFILGADESESLNGTSSSDIIVANNSNISKSDTIHGNGGNDQIIGGVGNDYLYGDAGNDQILGGTGNDYLNGGTGDDLLRGGYGNDTYVYTSGNDVIQETGDVGGQSNNLIISGSNLNQTIFTRTGNDLLLTFTNRAGSVTVQNSFENSRFAMSSYTFDDVSLGTYSSYIFASPGIPVIGTSGSENIIGTTGNDTIHGGAGADIINGLDGADSISGDAGDDVINGGSGDNIYYYQIGDGWDTITDAGGNDYIMMLGAPGVPLVQSDLILPVPSSTSVPGVTPSFKVKLAATGAVLIDLSQQSQSGHQIEKIYLNNDLSVSYNLLTGLWDGPGNDAPTARNDYFTAREDQLLTGNVLADNGYGADSDAEGDPLSVTPGTYSSLHGGAVTIQTDGSFSYLSYPDYYGPDSFAYQISDGQATSTATVTLAVINTNENPVAKLDEVTGIAGSVLTGNVFADNGHGVDFDPDGDPIFVSNKNFYTSAGNYVVLSLNGNFTISPATGFVGTESFNYIISDGAHGSATGSVTFTFTAPVNHNPIANEDDFTTNKGVAVTGNLFVNNAYQYGAGHGPDTDADGDTIIATAGSFTSVHGGIVNISANGDFSYAPAAHYYGMDSFTYEISDGHGGTATGTANIEINNVNHAPVAQYDYFTTDANTTVVGNLFADNGNGVDMDPDGDTITTTASSFTTINGGIVNISANGDFTYVPGPAATMGSDRFNYRIYDSFGSLSLAQVNITINAVNSAPVAYNDDFITDENASITGNLLVDNGHGVDVDSNGDALIVTPSTFTTAHGGAVTIDENGDFSYTPFTDYSGTDSFIYEVSDGHGGAASATVSVSINPLNTVPIAKNDVFAGTEDIVLTGNVLADNGAGADSDANNDTLTVQAANITTASGGTVVLLSNGDFSYTPAANYNGVDSFAYQIDDGHGHFSTATVTITLSAVNDAPIVQADDFNGISATAITGNVLSNNGHGIDYDIEGDALSVVASSFVTSQGNSVSISANGNFTYTSLPSFAGVDGFDYSVSDGHGGTATGHATLTVAPPAGAIVGTSGNDVINGTGSADVIYGLAGDDTINGNSGNDIIYAGAGNDTVDGNLGNDTLDGGDGVDTLSFATSGNAITFSLSTSSAQVTNAGTDSAVNFENLTGSGLNDNLEGSQGNNILNGGAGVDTVNYSHALTSVNVYLGAGQAQDTIGAGVDTLLNFENLSGSSFDDILEGDAGNNVLYGGGGSNTVSYVHASSAVTVTLLVGTAQNTVGAGSDTIQNFDNILGSAYNDTLTGNNTSNIIEGGAGNDTLNGGAGIDTVSYITATSAVTVNLSVTSAQNTGGAGIDTITNFENIAGSLYDDVLTGDAGANVIRGGAGGNDILDGGTGLDTVSYIDALAGVVVDITNTSVQNTVGGGNDLLTGFENITGSNFNDILTGDSGNNVISGGLGNDTVKYDGASAGVTVNLATAAAQNTIGAGTDTLTGIENLVGSSYNDTLTGDANNNIINGGDGNDVIVGGLGNDTLDGGIGVDTISYAAATAGVAVNLDNVIAQNTGVTGIDTISNFENINGSAYDDAITANASDNILDGGAGVDSISYATATSGVTINLGLTSAQNTGGSGLDTILNFENVTGSGYDDVLTGTTATNIINGGAGNDLINGGATPAQTSYVDILDGGSGIDTVSFASVGGLNFDLSITTQQLFFSNRSIIVRNIENVIGSSTVDTILGNAGDNILDGAAGVDTVSYANSLAGVAVNLSLTTAQNTGGAGYDTVINFENLTGSNYDDVLTGDSGSNIIIGGLGNDVLDGGAGTDTLYYTTATSGVSVNLGLMVAQDTVGAGIDTISNFERLYGSAYNDILIGSSGDDYIFGYGGQDIIDGGAGNDTLNGSGTVSYTSSMSGVTVYLSITTAQNTFGAGTDTINGFLNLTGSSYDDVLAGSSGNNIIHGGEGNDNFMYTAASSGGVDAFYGDGGSNYLNLVGAGTTTTNVNLNTNAAQNILYNFNVALFDIQNVIGGSGSDIVIGNQGDNYFNGLGGFDTISYAAATSGVTVDLAIKVEQDTVGAGIDKLVEVEKVIGSSYNDTLKQAVFYIGTSIDAGAGDDLVYASYTNIVADGGSGNDTVDLSRVDVASGEFKTFSLALTTSQYGYGTIINFENVIGGQNDNIISGTAGNNIMDGGAGINTVSYLNSGSAVTVNLGIATAQNTIGAGVDTLHNFQAVIGSNFDDILTGGSGNDTLTGELGNDIFDGADGSDTLSYASATSAITFNLALTTAQDTGGAGIDTAINFENLLGSGYNDTLIGDDGNNTINGGAGNDLISGGNGNDILSGGGSGFDTVTYASAGAGVSVDLTVTTAQNTIGAGIDALSGFKALVGSSYGDSIIAGTTSTNLNTANFTIDAGSGDDFVYVGRGVAILNGGAGSDTLVFSGSQFSYDGTTFNLSILTSQTGGPGQITAQNFENLIGSDAADNLTGDANNNIIEGGLGNDILDGGDGIDTLSYAHAISNLSIDLEVTSIQGVGAMGNDTVRNFENYLGSAYSDYLYVSAGNRTLVGGGGTDTLNYSHATAAINADLSLNVVQGAAEAWVHTVSEFENVIGTSYNDIIAGNAGNNVLNGGVGLNTVSYENASAGVTVSLAITAQQNTIGAGLDTLYNFQNINGSGFNDTLSGNSTNNIIIGDLGDDLLNGAGGNDTYVFGRNMGRDTINNGVSTANTSLGTLSFGTGISADQLWFDRVDDTGSISSTGNNLRITVMGSSTYTTVMGEFNSTTAYSRLNNFSLTDSGLVLDSQLNSLVSAMATFEAGYASAHGGVAFDPTAAGNGSITDTTLLAAVNSAWHS